MTTNTITRSKRPIYTRSAWERLGTDGQYRIGYADGTELCNEHGIVAVKYLRELKPINSYECGKQQSAIDWLSSRNVKVCGNCGNVGNDVHDWLAWVGGKGYVPITECDDLTRCWHRWNSKNGVK